MLVPKLIADAAETPAKAGRPCSTSTKRRSSSTNIDVSTIVVLRDRASIALVVYTFRVMAALHMSRGPVCGADRGQPSRAKGQRAACLGDCA
jgi:hypothetical protein